MGSGKSATSSLSWVPSTVTGSRRVHAVSHQAGPLREEDVVPLELAEDEPITDDGPAEDGAITDEGDGAEVAARELGSVCDDELSGGPTLVDDKRPGPDWLVAGIVDDETADALVLVLIAVADDEDPSVPRVPTVQVPPTQA